jgi:hypothetical protein
VRQANNNILLIAIIQTNSCLDKVTSNKNNLLGFKSHNKTFYLKDQMHKSIYRSKKA